MELINTQTKDELKLYGNITHTEAKDSIIIHIHGMSGDFYTNSYYPFMHDYYSKNNIAFLAGENRGVHSIKLTTKGNDFVNIGNAFEIFEECIHDIQVWIDYAEQSGYKKIYLQGHSLGPSKISYYVDQVNPKNIVGLIYISPSDMLGLVHDEYGNKDHKILYPEAKKLVAEGKGDQILSHILWESEYLSANTYLNFFSDISKTAIFNYGRQDLGWDVVNRIYLPVLAITGTKDDGIVTSMDSYKAMDLLKRQLKSSPKVTTKIYEGAEHGFDGYEKQIVEDVVEFVKSL